MRVARALAVFAVALVLAAAAGFAFIWHQRPGLDAYAARHYAAAPTPRALTATWFGTAAVLLSDGAHGVFIDPFFTRPPGFGRLVRNAAIEPDEALIRDWLARAGVAELSAVLVSHSHYDHAMDAGVVAKLTGAALVGSQSTLNVGRGAGLDAARLVRMGSGETRRFGSFEVTFVESRHAGASGGRPTGDILEPLVPPARFLDYKQGGTYSILVGHPQGRVLHHGSAGYAPGALAGRRADVVLLGVAMMPDLPGYLGEVVDATGARRVIPVHWDDFTRPLDAAPRPFPIIVRLDRFFERMASERPDLAVQTLELGRRVALFPGATP